MKKAKIISFLCLLIIAGLVLINIYLIPTTGVPLSTDQKKLVDSFDYPDTFMLVLDKGIRYETWQYLDLGKNFVFMDGVFQLTNNVPQMDDASVILADFKPDQFRTDLSEEELVSIVGLAPLVAQTDNEALGLVRSLNFEYKLIANYKDGQLFSVQTLPLTKEVIE